MGTLFNDTHFHSDRLSKLFKKTDERDPKCPTGGGKDLGKRSRSDPSIFECLQMGNGYSGTKENV